MNKDEEVKRNLKSSSADVESSEAGHSDSSTTPKSSKTIGSGSTPPQTPRRFSSSSARSFDNNDYYISTPKSQRVSSAMSLYGRGYSRGLTRRVSINSSISNFSTMSETSLPWTTKNDIPTIPHVNIRKIKPTDFNSYIKQITPVFERYRNNKEFYAEGSQSRKSETSLTEESPAASATNLLANNLENLQTSKDVGSQIPVHRLASTRNPYTVHLPPPSPGDDRPPEPVIELPLLETVPSIFFDPDFNLENPRTFDIVCEQTDIIEAKKGLEVIRLKRRRANMGRLFEGLRMVSEIKSTQPMIQVLLGQGDYFSALDLIDEANIILHVDEGQKIQSAENVVERETNNSESINHRATMVRRLSNVADGFKRSGTIDLRSVRVLVHFGDKLTEMYKTIGVMMENDLLNMLFLDFGEHVETVNKSKTIRSLYNYKIPLSAKHGATSINVTIDSEIMEKEDNLKKRITPLVLGLYRHYESKDDQLADGSKEQSSNMLKFLKGMTFDAFLQMLLSIYSVLLEGLKRIAIYNELFTTILRDVETNDNYKISDDESNVKDEQASTPKNDSNSSLSSLDGSKNPNSSLDKEENSKNDSSSSSVNSTSSLNSRFNALKITTGIKSIIQKTTSLTNKPLPPTPSSVESVEKETAIALPTNTKSKKSRSDSKDHNSQSISDSAQIVYAAADLAHVRCANLIAVRADQNAQLNQKDFYRLFNVTSAFVLECESLCGRMCYGLRGTIMSQKTRQAAALVENEQWVQELVPIDYQRIVDKIVNAAVSGLSDFRDDPLESVSPPISPVFPMTSLSTSSRNDGDEHGTINNSTSTNGTTNITTPVNPSNNGSSRYIFVEERRFFVVGCSITLIKLLGDYLRCMVNIPTLTNETMNRVVDILNLFNSRTCQVILGAGAMRSAGLKNITAKHLALASQSLGAMIALIPFIRECIRHSLNTKQAVMLTEFDRIKRDYINHQNEIHGKLVSIMNERLVIHLKSFQAINWDEESTNEAPNKYMEILVKETTTLHKVLNKYLPIEILQNVMTEIFKSSSTKLAEEIGNVKITTAIGKKRLMTDAQYYIRKLSTLEGLQGPSDELEMAIKNIHVDAKEDLSITTPDVLSPSK
ncbi:9227_t:CDS:10 [Funneliformis geosporum]|uniref:9227_t:CDS:1 n=1 Tax=Funneliformis geosporum TaxID=1117311 RepID=A0A9W4SIL6_9GLOM|nr:9227_t:CDS:10 [Funneliformis geosporum]